MLARAVMELMTMMMKMVMLLLWATVLPLRDPTSA